MKINRKKSKKGQSKKGLGENDNSFPTPLNLASFIFDD